MNNDLLKKDLRALCTIVVCLTLLVGSCNVGEIKGKDDRAKWHCESQGYEAFQITDRGTIECIKITREVVR